MEFAQNTIIGLEIFWRSAVALSIRTLGRMHRDVRKCVRESSFGCVDTRRLV